MSNRFSVYHIFLHATRDNNLTSGCYGNLVYFMTIENESETELDRLKVAAMSNSLQQKLSKTGYQRLSCTTENMKIVMHSIMQCSALRSESLSRKKLNTKQLPLSINDNLISYFPDRPDLLNRFQFSTITLT